MLFCERSFGYCDIFSRVILKYDYGKHYNKNITTDFHY